MFNPFKQNKKHTIGAILVFLFGIFLLSFQQPVSAEEQLRIAREAKVKAMRQSCEVIGDKYASCFSGDRQDCKDLQEKSIPWFNNEYGQYPELACSTDDPFFVTGAK